MSNSSLHYRTFLCLLIAVTIAFGFILWPFYGAVFWGTILAIIFAPLHRTLLEKLNGKRNLAAFITLMICLLIVIFPVAFVAGAIVQQGTALYTQIHTGQLDFGSYFQKAMAAMPTSMHSYLDRFGLTDIPSLQGKLEASASAASQFLATQALSIGQNTFQFIISFGIMLYLLFFLLRDGAKLSMLIGQAIPLANDHKRHLFRKFITVVRATVKGNIAVAAAQGALGGLIFWILGIEGALLWGALMAFLSLLPAIGAALVWGPVAIYFLLTGALVKGVILTAFCVLVIGLVDNILRPLLVGRDTRMPDYVILISTLGGMALFGINGFVIGPLTAALFMAVWDLFSSANGGVSQSDRNG